MTSLIGYQCRCGTKRQPHSWRETVGFFPNDRLKWRCDLIPVCFQDHDMEEVDLCLACDALGKTTPVYEDFGLCLEHAQKAQTSESLTELIREIALLPGRMRS